MIAPFRLVRPAERMTSVLFASPHSGRAYPEAFLRATMLDERAIRSSEDAFVDDLLEDVPRFGAPLLTATMPRAFVDLNRAVDELDPALIEGVVGLSHNPRIASGLGVIPRVVAGGRAIHQGKISLHAARERIDRWWWPYHAALQSLLDESRRSFGEAILIDMHSMPHEAMEAMSFRAGKRPDIVIGDRYGAAAASRIVERIEDVFRAEGFRVARNAPFAGAYTAQAYGRPALNQHAVQIEIDRALYMDERRIARSATFSAFRLRLDKVLAEIAGIGAAERRMAAE